MEKYENLRDKKTQKRTSKAPKVQKDILATKLSQSELEKFYKLVEGHKKLLIALGKL